MQVPAYYSRAREKCMEGCKSFAAILQSVLFSRAREVQAIHRFHANVVVRIIHARATCMNIMHYKAGKKSGNP